MRYRSLWVLLLIGCVYGSVLTQLLRQFYFEPNSSYGFFIPPFALYVVWRERERLLAVQSAPSWTGLVGVVIAALLLFVGVVGSEPSFSRASLLVLLAGLIVLLDGWRFFRAVLFPWFVLALMIPIPTVLLDQLTSPLHLLALKTAAATLTLFGSPVVQQGNMINLPSLELLISPEDSGVRSLASWLTLSVMLGYFVDDRPWVRWVLALASVPILVVTISVRILSMVRECCGNAAEGYSHDTWGWITLVLFLLLFFVAHRVIRMIWKTSKRNGNGIEELIEPEKLSGQLKLSKDWIVRFGIAAVLMLAAKVAIHVRSGNKTLPPRQPLSFLLMNIDGWNGVDVDLDSQVRDMLPNEQPSPLGLCRRFRGLGINCCD